MVGLDFGVVKPLTEERPRPGETALAYALRNARDKAIWTIEQFYEGYLNSILTAAHDQGLIICADTIVVLDGKIIEKPQDESDAASILRRLSGRSHSVISGVALASVDRTDRQAVVEEHFTVETKVWFKSLTARAIESYIASGEPMDKAGAYAIQGMGGMFVTRIEGSFSNVIGLPVAEVVDALEHRYNYRIWMESRS